MRHAIVKAYRAFVTLPALHSHAPCVTLPAMSSDKPAPAAPYSHLCEYVSRASLESAMPHMRTVCTRCGSEWMVAATGRSLWIRPFCGGPGQVAQVGEIFCPRCDPAPELPQYGTPIYTDELAPLGPFTRVHPPKA
jgi:hypothetical protein